ncbi:hypothetical protein AC579_4097 [Pseudocercospora musae]|uniref:Nephrocystin 3-like N-terminal domain-containing protein n=1 Tax=Pseudocercospora musae TaxID=113226 RepID=A0A139IJH2_9PEZI|nr:hypothetical protein AC579_4097 [Pseudocercospora musae]
MVHPGIKVQRVLQTLAYPGMEDRQDNPEAAQETYNWILDSKDKSAFSTWPSEESDDRSFWISGKADLGKSTLMNMINDSDQTTSLLEAWAGARNLIIGHHFFLVSGHRDTEVLRGSATWAPVSGLSTRA